MANDAQLLVLKQGSDAWREWLIRARASSGEWFEPDLKGADLNVENLTGVDLSFAQLNGASLRGANLSGANLSGANLNGADLTGAKLNEANISGTNLSFACLSGANLYGANLSRANLDMADLTDASLYRADLREAHLSGADLSGANLSAANLREADVTVVRWDRSRMRGRYQGIRGIDSCYGDALFRRAAADQDFLDTLEASWLGSRRKYLFLAWGLLDYGRSMGRTVLFAFLVATVYGIIYALFRDLLTYADSADTWFTPFYFSIVTFSTLGFGDVKPRCLAGEMLVCTEVILGYLTLGLLLAVLAEKLARRS